MRRNTYINNLKMLVLAGLVLGKSDVTNLASDVDNPAGNITSFLMSIPLIRRFMLKEMLRKGIMRNI